MENVQDEINMVLFGLFVLGGKSRAGNISLMIVTNLSTESEYAVIADKGSMLDFDIGLVVNITDNHL